MPSGQRATKMSAVPSLATNCLPSPPGGESHLRVDAGPEEVDVLLDALRLHPHLVRRRPRLEYHREPQLAIRLNSLNEITS